MSSQLAIPEITQTVTGGGTVEITAKGKWIRVPALQVDGKAIIVRGEHLRVAFVHNENWLDTEVGNPELCVNALKGECSHRLRADMFTFAQIPPAATPKYSYPVEWESVAAVRTSNFEDWWKQLPQEGRKNVRRSQKRGVVVTVSKLDDILVRALVELNNDSPMRQKIPFAHYGKSLDQVRKDQSTFLDRSEFICAYFGNELVGFMKLVYRGESASVLQFIPKASRGDMRPANALLARAVEVCEGKGISYLTYGMMNYGNKRDSSLRDFKCRNGFEEMLMPRFYIPLNAKGRLCMKLNLHRGLLGILPPHVIALGVKARAKWYDLVNPMSRCSSMVERPRL